MDYFRSTGTSGGLLFTRTSSVFVRERTSEMLQAAALADTAVAAARDDARESARRVAKAVLATVGEGWAEGCADDDVRELVAIAAGGDVPIADGTFDRICSEALRLRFAKETARPEFSSTWA
jgi:hypothetical protein